MVKKNKENLEEKKDTEQSFLEKYKTDKKFNAKVQLIGYGVFILIIIVYANISSLNTSYTTNHTNIESPSSNSQINTTDDKKTLLENINNNYQYEVKASIKELKENESGEHEEITKEIKYEGKRYQNNLEILKRINNEEHYYYKVDSRYYTKNENNFELIDEEKIYNEIDKEFIELEPLKETIDASSLDHVTEYSNGKREYVYHLKVKDIIKSSQNMEKIEINIVEENNTLRITIDYTNLIKELVASIKECKVEYVYQNIGAIEPFTIIENDDSNTNIAEKTNE